MTIANNHLVTVGDDNKIIIWDYVNWNPIAIGSINNAPGKRNRDGFKSSSQFADNQCSRAICFNPSSEEIAFGTNNGEIHIRDFSDITTDKMMVSCTDKWIRCMSYSPDGKMLAVGTHDKLVFVYSLPDYEVKAKITDHNSPVICIDWSSDSNYLRTLEEGFKLYFWKTSSMSQDSNGAQNTKDVEWSTQSCKIGWSVQGIYPPGMKKDHVNAVTISKDGKFLATGDKHGLVKIYNYPCLSGAASCAFRYI